MIYLNFLCRCLCGAVGLLIVSLAGYGQITFAPRVILTNPKSVVDDTLRIATILVFSEMSFTSQSLFVDSSADNTTTTVLPTPQPVVIKVSNAAQLQRALDDAAAGQTIQMADGIYSGRFTATADGTAASKITLRGSRNAILDGGSHTTGYGLYLNGANYWQLIGFTVQNSQKGIMLDLSNNNLVDNVRVLNTGEEAVHFRKFSCDNTIQNSLITDTGKQSPRYGEGVYLGTAQSNWRSISDGNPDMSNNNRVLDNIIGPGVTAEHVDIKEGTTGGTISGNTFKGEGISGENYADSWVDVMGSRYLITGNTGFNSSGTSALIDGFQTHQILTGSGNNNIFSNNTAHVNAAGYGFNIHTAGTGNIVYSNNTVSGARSGVSNIPLVSP